MINEVKIGDVKPNAKNPRVIKDEKFKQLVKSIERFPEMLQKRPLVVVSTQDGKFEVLGGNMRLAALKHLKRDHVPVILADDWSEEQRTEFLISDNVNYGMWDWDMLANEWDVQDLEQWGLEMPFVDTASFGEPGGMQEVEEEYNNEAEQKVYNSLSDKFIVPPFSVFDTKQGYWQSRKAAWKSLGIQSEVGRGGNLLNYSETILQASNPKKKLAEVLKGNSPNTANVESKIPNYYAKKEQGYTDAEIIKEFIETSELSGTSVFDPVLCEISYKWFCKDGGTILDPFAGGSVRGVVASKVGRNYVGVDLRAEQVEANEKQVQELCESHHPKYIVGSSENITELFNSLDEKPVVDMIFTCPPYYDLEQYSESDQDLSAMSYEEFDKAYESIIEQSIKLLSDDSFSVFVVGDVRDKDGVYLDLIGKTVEAHKKAGAVFYNSAILLESVGTAGLRAARIFNGGRKLCKVHQNVLVFYKGNIANIKSKFGTIVAEVEEFESNNTEYGDKIQLEVSI
jgi:16S rRNA G966 N2-methylase RsmD